MNNKFKLEDVYSGIGNIFVVTKDLGEDVEILILSNNSYTRTVSKEVLKDFEKGSFNAISKLLDIYSKDFPKLYVDITCNIFLTNVEYSEIRDLDAEAHRINDKEKRMERFREIRRKHVRVVLTDNNEASDSIENIRIIANSNLKELIATMGLCFNNGEISAKYLSILFSQFKNINKELNKIWK